MYLEGPPALYMSYVSQQQQGRIYFMNLQEVKANET